MRKMLLMAGAAVLYSAGAHAGDATVEIIQPAAVNQIVALDFGQVANGDGTVTVPHDGTTPTSTLDLVSGTANRGEFEVDAAASTNVTVTVDSSVTLTGSCGSIPVTLTNSVSNPMQDGDPFYVGGIAYIGTAGDGADTVGTCSETFNVTADYD